MSRHPLVRLAALALVWLFALLAASCLAIEDRWLLSALYAGGDPRLAALAAALTDLGGWLVLLLAALIGAAVLIGRGRRRDAGLLLAIALGGRMLVEAQKLAIGRARPDLHHLDAVHSFSFPSGHSANAMITALALALLLSGRRWAIVAALAFAFAIGCTRMMLGVHWPSDVLGGWAFGALWVLALVGVSRRSA